MNDRMAILSYQFAEITEIPLKAPNTALVLGCLTYDIVIQKGRNAFRNL